jgi:hypothetical protein
MEKGDTGLTGTMVKGNTGTDGAAGRDGSNGSTGTAGATGATAHEKTRHQSTTFLLTAMHR